MIPRRINDSARSHEDSPAAEVLAPKVLTRALHRAAENLGMSQGELAATIGASDASVSHLWSEERTIDPQSKEGALALHFLRLYRNLDAMVGSDEARNWFHAPNSHLQGIPAELVKTAEGLFEVTQYLDAMRGKA